MPGIHSTGRTKSLIRSVVVSLTSGMEMDLTVFPAGGDGEPSGSLKTDDDLDQYTYHVAGCVGEFWTAITMAHTPALSNWGLEQMSEGRRQVREGPATDQRAAGHSQGPAHRTLLFAGSQALGNWDSGRMTCWTREWRQAARPALTWGIEQALEHYDEAVAYILAIPRGCLRLRLAALWPVIIGLATLAKLAQKPRLAQP